MLLGNLLVSAINFKECKYYHYALALLLGSLLSLAFAPLNLFPIVVVCISGLLFITTNAPPRQAFFIGLIFGIGYFACSLYWLYYAFATVNLSYWGPFGIFGLSLWLALFPALSCALTSFFTAMFAASLANINIRRVWLFATFWGMTEWLRSHLLTGFPWNLLGYVWDNGTLQSTAWIGIYGLSFLTVLTAASFSSRSWKMILGCLGLMLTISCCGNYRLSNNPVNDGQNGAENMVNIRIVQASIPQQEKWLQETREKNLKVYINLSRGGIKKIPDVIIWPEVAVTMPIAPGNEVLGKLQPCVSPAGLLITGGIRVDRTALEKPSIYNSLFVINDQGNIINCYDKAHLTPFGEYMPLGKVLKINKLTHGSIDYQAGLGPKVLNSAILPPFQPLICYEGIFPNLIKDFNFGAKWFLSLTNDAWFGDSWGPPQHLAIVKVRAIEHGIPLIRAANSGISAVIDSYGRILQRLDVNQVGVMDFKLPESLGVQTFYGQWREIPFLIMLIVGLIIGSPFYYLRRNNKTWPEQK